MRGRSLIAASAFIRQVDRVRVPVNVTPSLRFECRKSACHEGGDHMIMVDEVERAALSDGSPLMFFGGKLGSFGCFEQAS